MCGVAKCLNPNAYFRDKSYCVTDQQESSNRDSALDPGAFIPINTGQETLVPTVESSEFSSNIPSGPSLFEPTILSPSRVPSEGFSQVLSNYASNRPSLVSGSPAPSRAPSNESAPSDEKSSESSNTPMFRASSSGPSPSPPNIPSKFKHFETEEPTVNSRTKKKGTKGSRKKHGSNYREKDS